METGQPCERGCKCDGCNPEAARIRAYQEKCDREWRVAHDDALFEQSKERYELSSRATQSDKYFSGLVDDTYLGALYIRMREKYFKEHGCDMPLGVFDFTEFAAEYVAEAMRKDSEKQ